MGRPRGGALLVGSVLALTGCTITASPEDPGTTVVARPPSVSASVPTPTSASTTGGPGVGLPPVAFPSRTAPRSCSDAVLTARTVHLRGSRGSVHWDLAIPELSGARSAAEVNRHVRASAQDAIDLGLREGRDDDGVRRDVGGSAAVTTNDRRTVQVELTWADSLAGTAHPTTYVATTVVTTDAGRPVRLRDVLGDEPSALRALARAVEKQVGRVDTDGLAPKERNFAAWQTTGRGMRLTFQDGQLGPPGLRTVTVPWRTVRPLLSAYGTGLLDPDVDPTTC
jgi:hypothetical protein